MKKPNAPKWYLPLIFVAFVLLAWLVCSGHAQKKQQPPKGTCRVCDCRIKAERCDKDCNSEKLCRMACTHACSGTAKPFCPYYRPKKEKL